MPRFCKFFFVLVTMFSGERSYSQISLPTPHVESILFLGKGKKQPLVVGLGGSEGGNAWSGDYWKKTRDRFIDSGYAFLALGYFGAKGTPAILNEIEIEDVHKAIQTAAGYAGVDKSRIAIIGGSRGADLALLLASYHKDIKCVVSIVGSNAVFPGHTLSYNTPCWTYQGKPLPFLPVNDAAVPYLMKRDLRGAFTSMLSDSLAVSRSSIQVEKIRGPILFLSATKDEVCPSTPMADRMMERLKQHQFRYHAAHEVIEGGHASPLKHFDLVFRFLDQNFNREKNHKKAGA